MSPCLDATIRDGVLKGGHRHDNPSDNTEGRSLATNVWAQLGLVTAVVVIVIAFAWQYVW
jgi:hypothetical protein